MHEFANTGSIARQPLIMAAQSCKFWFFFISNKCNGLIYIIKEKLETLFGMDSYLPTSDRHAASWIFSDGPSKQLGVVKLRYNALKLFFIMSLFYANVPVSASQRACFCQLLQTRSIVLHTSWLINKVCLY